MRPTKLTPTHVQHDHVLEMRAQQGCDIAYVGYVVEVVMGRFGIYRKPLNSNNLVDKATEVIEILKTCYPNSTFRRARLWKRLNLANIRPAFVANG